MNTARELYEELGNLLMKNPELNDVRIDACGVPGSLLLWRKTPDGPITGLSYEDDDAIDKYEGDAQEWLKEMNKEALSEQHMGYLVQLCMTDAANEDIEDFINQYAITNDELSHAPSAAPSPSNDIPYTILAERKIKLTKEDIADIVNTSFDGGITAMWVKNLKVKGEMLGEFGGEHIAADGTLEIRCVDEKEYRELTLSKILSGLKLWYENSKNTDEVVKSDDTLDLFNIDAIVADAIIQYALFGEVVYG